MGGAKTRDVVGILFVDGGFDKDERLGRVAVLDICLFLKVGNSAVSIAVLSLLAGIELGIDMLIESLLADLHSGGGVFWLFTFCNSVMTACKIRDMLAAGWYVYDISCNAPAKHSRYCILFLRSFMFLMNARAATSAVAAVPACCIPVTKIRRVSNRCR